MRSFLILVVALCCQVIAAQDLSLPSTPKAVKSDSGFNLAPGERLLSVDGVPVSSDCPGGRCALRGPVVGAVVGAAEGFADGLLQQKANAMARKAAVFHASGGYVVGASCEGVGSGSTPQAAVSNCCYYGRRAIVGQAVARGANGRWYAVIQCR